MEPNEEDSEPRCEVCGKEIARGEDCYQVSLGHFGEGVGEFITEDIVAYAHEGCLPLDATL